jgi:hypothetical protein
MIFPHKNKNRSFLLAVFLFFTLSVYTSCKKCDCTCGDVVITVLDSLDNPVEGALVNLTCDPTENPGCTIDYSVVTDANGRALFSFCEAGILKIFVDGAPEGYVEIEVGETVEKIIKQD